jgi:hypothetical protein
MSETPWYLQDYKKSMRSKGRLIPLVETQLMKANKERNLKRDTQHLHPSELSKKDWCGRAAVYKITGAASSEESFAFGRLNVFEEGHAIHHKWQTWLWKAGVLSGSWECRNCHHYWSALAPTTCPDCASDDLVYREVPISNDELRIIGHADGEVVDSEGRALIEIKSVGLGTVRFEKPTMFADYSNGTLTLDGLWKNIKTPFASHIRQGNLYMHCTGVHTIVFIYEWKPTQEVKEFVLKYNPQVVEPLIENCKSVIQALDEGTVPERPEWAINNKCRGCQYCPYKKVCWS